MSFFGLFGKNTGEGAVKKHAARVADKRAQAPDRWDSIQALGAMKTREAVTALLSRFSFYSDPSITDQEEKDEAFRLIVESGDVAIEPVLSFLQRSESLGWALKLLERMLPAERVVAELLAVLAKMDTEYERDPTRKLQNLQALEDRRDPRIADGVARFVEDVNEGARFHAVGALLAQEDPSATKPLLVSQLEREDSMRIRARIVEAFAAHGWEVGSARGKIEKALPAGFSLDKAGVPRKKP